MALWKCVCMSLYISWFSPHQAMILFLIWCLHKWKQFNFQLSFFYWKSSFFWIYHQPSSANISWTFLQWLSTQNTTHFVHLCLYLQRMWRTAWIYLLSVMIYFKLSCSKQKKNITIIIVNIWLFPTQHLPRRDRRGVCYCVCPQCVHRFPSILTLTGLFLYTIALTHTKATSLQRLSLSSTNSKSPS